MRIKMVLSALALISLPLLDALSASAQTIQTVAGGERYANSPALQVSVGLARGIAYAPNGTVYVVSGNQIEQFNPATGTITTVAGNGAAGFLGDGGTSTSAELSGPSGVAVDSVGNLYIADAGNNVIRKVTAASGIITTVAGNGTQSYSGDGGAATSAELSGPSGVAVDSVGNLYIADAGNNLIRKVTAATGVISTVAGHGGYGYSGDGGPATSGELSYPSGVAVDSSGNLYIADSYNSRIRLVSLATGIITTVAGNGAPSYSGDGGPATGAEINYPNGIAVDSSGNLYIADSFNNLIRKVTVATGIISTVAGDGTFGYSGDGGPATGAELNYPSDVAVDSSGNLYIADEPNERIRMVSSATGIISTVAGNGSVSNVGNGGPATSAAFNQPTSVAVDSSGNLYIADYTNQRIRLVNAATGIITTVAGNGFQGYSGDGGAATNAELSGPAGVAVDSVGNLFIADELNQRIRRVSAATGIITTVAGNGMYGYTGDGVSATSANLSYPIGVAVDSSGNLYIGNPTIAEFNTIIETGAPGCSSSTAPCIDAAFGPTQAFAYWSSSSSVVDPHGVWAVTFFNGEVGNFYSKIPAMYARAVRTAR
jgi:sugar lactone lactonase YvrE